VQVAWKPWIEAQPAMDVEKLVFFDETWATANMTRSHGRVLRRVAGASVRHPSAIGKQQPLSPACATII
jgi:hypothetical protein